jgi:hypothetical protein
MSRDDTYEVISGYDSRIIATGLTEQERDDLIDRICARMDDYDGVPKWRRENR